MADGVDLFENMPKRRKRGQPRHPRLPPQPTPRTKTNPAQRLFATLRTPIGTLCAFVGLLLAIVGTYYLFRTDVLVEPDVAIDSKQLLTTLFRVTNEGVLPIYKVNRFIDINRLAATTTVFQDFRLMTSNEPDIPILKAKESTTVEIPKAWEGDFTGGDITVVINYTSYLKKRKTKEVRFKTITLADGSKHWSHKAVSEK